MLEQNFDINEIIESFKDYKTRLGNGCINISEDLRKGKYSSAINNIILFTEGVNWLIEVANKLEILGYQTDIDRSELLPILNETNEAVGNGDYVLLADLFEYDLAMIFEK